MKIISNFKDYYDSAMGYGQEPGVVYQRTAQLIHFAKWRWDIRVIEALSKQFIPWDLPPCLGIIGFCGRIYPVWLDTDAPMNVDSLTRNKDSVRLSFEQATEQTSARNLANYVTPPSRKFLDEESLQIKEAMEDVSKGIQPYIGATISQATFIDLNVPVFLVTLTNVWRLHKLQDATGTILTNPRLATLGFQQDVDAFSAFQEIAMFLGSALAKDRIAPDTVGDDELIAKSKGFDEQSFRTAAPGQKKLNRKLNKETKRRKKEE